MPVLLAHGALGPFDEIIFIGVAIVFLAMMGVSWLRSQQLTDEDLELTDKDREQDTERYELE